jgi:hypothetical protein
MDGGLKSIIKIYYLIFRTIIANVGSNERIPSCQVDAIIYVDSESGSDSEGCGETIETGQCGSIRFKLIIFK